MEKIRWAGECESTNVNKGKEMEEIGNLKGGGEKEDARKNGQSGMMVGKGMGKGKGTKDKKGGVRDEWRGARNLLTSVFTLGTTLNVLAPALTGSSLAR